MLLTKRADDGSWCAPAGAAEPGGSFARTAVDELAEETGIEGAENDLIPFGCLSEAEGSTGPSRNLDSERSTERIGRVNARAVVGSR